MLEVHMLQNNNTCTMQALNINLLTNIRKWPKIEAVTDRGIELKNLHDHGAEG